MAVVGYYWVANLTHRYITRYGSMDCSDMLTSITQDSAPSSDFGLCRAFALPLTLMLYPLGARVMALLKLRNQFSNAISSVYSTMFNRGRSRSRGCRHHPIHGFADEQNITAYKTEAWSHVLLQDLGLSRSRLKSLIYSAENADQY